MATEIVSFIIGAFLGCAAGAIVIWWTNKTRAERLAGYVDQLEQDLAASEARLDLTTNNLSTANTNYQTLERTLRATQSKWAAAEAQLKERTDNLREQKVTFEKSKTQLTAEFRSLAGLALAANNDGFLKLAETKFGTLKKESEADLEARRVAVETLVKPMSEALAAFQLANTDLENKRQNEMGTINQQLTAITATHTLLQQETNRLVTALRSPKVRGNWGEVTLRRTAEMSGMIDRCHFEQQVTVETDDGKLRPDMVINLPAKRDVVVDSKVPLEQFMESLRATTEEQKLDCLQKHADHVYAHVQRLSSRAYWEQFKGSLDFVVLFIPTDTFLDAALEHRPELIEESIKRKVILASPSTLFALLRALEFAWKQHLIVENAHKVSALGEEMFDRIAKFMEHVQKIGTPLGRAVESYNNAIGSFQRRIMPIGLQFKKLGAHGRKTLEPLKEIDEFPRDIVREPSELTEDDEAPDQGGAKPESSSESDEE